MAKKIIQVPIDEELLKDLNSLSKKKHKNRSELIRQACVLYLREIEYQELDRIYQQGYTRIPEETAVAETQVAIAGEFLPKESW